MRFHFSIILKEGVRGQYRGSPQSQAIPAVLGGSTMSLTMLEKAQAVDPDILADVVRQDQRDPSFQILDWTVAPLSSQGIINPEGILLFSGRGRDGHEVRPWSVVLKMIAKPPQREFLFAQSGLAARLPAAVVPPRVYAVSEDADCFWIWMERLVSDHAEAWTLDDYAFAARQAGRLNGAFVTSQPLPEFPWLGRGHVRGWLRFPATIDPYQNPIITGAFSPALLARVRQLWDESERFLAVLDRLPQTFSHFDMQRRNLFIRRRADGEDELAALDWANCGIGALGGELSFLVPGNVAMFSVGVADLPALDAAAGAAYLSGLHDAGWRGDPQIVRLGYAAWASLYFGAATPAIASHWTASEAMRNYGWQQFGLGPEELAQQWAGMCEFCIDLGDEALELMETLGLSQS
jgi:hypothetical protein